MTRHASHSSSGRIGTRMLASAALLAVVAWAGPAAAEDQRGTLSVASQPAGASVTVDGLPVGVTPLEVPIGVGEHVIVVDLPGHHVETRTVAVTIGLRQDVSVVLRAVDASNTVSSVGAVDDDGGAGSGKGLWPWLGIGAGGGALAAGIVLVAVDSKPVEDGAQQRREVDTALAGYLAIGAGAALVTAGLVALFWDGYGQPEGDGTGPRPAVGFGPGGAPVVGVGGSF